MMLYEAIAAALVALAVVALIIWPADPTRRDAAARAPTSPRIWRIRPRAIALAALREIEFDRATGKLSDEDYAAPQGEVHRRRRWRCCGRTG